MSRKPNQTILDTQTRLNNLGFDPGGLDGLWGPKSETAFQNMYSTLRKKHIAWGSKFTKDELSTLTKVMKDEGFKDVDESDMMSCIAFETGSTFSPSIVNKVSSSTGLIQFMPATARGLGTTTSELAKMTVSEQLVYVGKYFKPYAKRVKDITDLYASILWPRGIGQPGNYVYWSKPNIAYNQNAGLDLNNDGKVTKEEASHMIKNRYVRGMDPSVRSDR